MQKQDYKTLRGVLVINLDLHFNADISKIVLYFVSERQYVPDEECLRKVGRNHWILL